MTQFYDFAFFRDVVLDEEPELEDQVSEDDTAGREEAERLAKEEEERKAEVSFTTFILL